MEEVFLGIDRRPKKQCAKKNPGPSQPPKEEDLIKLREYIETFHQSLQNFTFFGKNFFLLARFIIVACLTLYNAGCGGKASNLTLQQWDDDAVNDSGSIQQM